MSDSDESDVPDLWAYPDPTAAAVAPQDDEVQEVDVPTTSYGTRSAGEKKRTRKELEMEKWLEAAGAGDDKSQEEEVMVVETKRPARGANQKQSSQDVLEELGLGSPPVVTTAVKKAPAKKSAAMEKFDKMFDLSVEVEDEPPPPPTAARGGAAETSGRGGASAAVAAAAKAKQESDDEIEVEEEPIMITIRVTERCTKKIKIKPNQTFEKAIKYINDTLEEGKELAAKRGRRLVLKFDGDAIQPGATPNSMGIEADDVIDVS